LVRIERRWRGLNVEEGIVMVLVGGWKWLPGGLLVTKKTGDVVIKATGWDWVLV
jgi:hypothetical protein